MKLEKLKEAIERSWSRETCHLRLQAQWSMLNPMLGQCVPTTLVIQDYFGGSIFHDIKNKHYWNILDSGEEIDLTRGQFPEGTIFESSEIIERQDLFVPKALTKERYLILKDSVEKYLGV